MNAERVILAQEIESRIERLEAQHHRLQKLMRHISEKRVIYSDLLQRSVSVGMGETTKRATFTDQLLQLVNERPGIDRDTAIALIDDDRERRRSLLTQIGNLIRGGRLSANGKSLYPAETGHSRDEQTRRGLELTV